jgi:hypothetical protein
LNLKALKRGNVLDNIFLFGLNQYCRLFTWHFLKL